MGLLRSLSVSWRNLGWVWGVSEGNYGVFQAWSAWISVAGERDNRVGQDRNAR